MLAKKFKLPIQHYQFGKKNKNTTTQKGDFFVAKITPNNLNFNRFGIIISVKTIKSAAKRNKLKRMFFDFVRLSELKRSPGKDILLIITANQ